MVLRMQGRAMRAPRNGYKTGVTLCFLLSLRVSSLPLSPTKLTQPPTRFVLPLLSSTPKLLTKVSATVACPPFLSDQTRSFPGSLSNKQTSRASSVSL